MRSLFLIISLLPGLSVAPAALSQEALTELHGRAERGDAAAALQLGHFYATGEGVKPDETAAAYWYLVAAQYGLPEAQLSVGLRFATGQGVARDLRQAHMWINLAAVHSVSGSWEARDRLAELMTSGELAEAVQMAIEWQPRTAADLTSANGPYPPLP